MTDTMTPERFAALAEAYGGAIARWPEDTRDAARRKAADPAMAALLASADRLDAHLESWRVAPPSASLANAVTARAPQPLFGFRPGRWWAALAALGLAGAGAGAAAAAALAPAAAVSGDWTGDDTAFGDIGRES